MNYQILASGTHRINGNVCCADVGVTRLHEVQMICSFTGRAGHRGSNAETLHDVGICTCTPVERNLPRLRIYKQDVVASACGR